jgi:hypothetical protein
LDYKEVHAKRKERELAEEKAKDALEEIPEFDTKGDDNILKALLTCG